MKKIELNQYKGVIHYALVDDEDFDRVNQYRWHYRISGRNEYAYRKAEREGKRHNVFLHRFIMRLGRDDAIEIDHINFNGLDNTKSNLRTATRQENVRHSRKDRDAQVSQYKGVHYESSRKKWRAYIYLNKKKIWLGRFINEVSAARAYNKKAKEMFGEYAVFNNIAINNGSFPTAVAYEGRARRRW